MSNLLDEIFNDAPNPVAPPSDAALGRVAKLAEEQQKIERDIEELKKKLEARIQDLTQVRTKALPDLMKELGLESFKLIDGSEVTVKTEYFASIKPENKLPAFTWFREQGHEDLIKNEVVLTFGRGGDAKAAKVEAWCQKQKLPYERTEQVHPMTLKAFVGEQIKKGSDIPFDLLGVHVVDVAKIKPPRAARK